MAVPRIVRVLPYGAPLDVEATGPVGGGALVEIYGGGFRVPIPVSSPSGIGASQRTVDVLFGGQAAEAVAVVRSNLIRVVTPPSPVGFDYATNSGGEGTVDVVVRNLDDAGDPVPGEEVTAAAGYKYLRPRLDDTAEQVLARIERALIVLMRRSVLDNTMSVQSVEYDSQTADGLQRVDIARLPVLVLIGPRLSRNGFYSSSGSILIRAQDVAGAPPERLAVLARYARTVDMVYDVVGAVGPTTPGGPHGGKTMLLNLMGVLTSFVHRSPYLEVQRDPVDAALGSVRYEFDFAAGADPAVDRTPSDSDMMQFSGTLVIRGVDIQNLAGVPGSGDGVTSAVADVENVVVDVGRYTP
jgi:hypothetical protein